MPQKEMSLVNTLPGDAKVHWGILGSARINDKLMPFMKSRPDSVLRGHSSRDAAKSRLYAREKGIERSFASYDELIASPDVNAVYLSLPNSEHFAWAKRVLESGKHLLLEKPLVMQLEEFHALKKIAESKQLLLMEGFMYAFHLQTQKLIELVRDGHLGTVKNFRASFHFVLEDTSNIRLRPELGGGAMWDIGCYICSLVALLFPGNTIERSHAVLRKNYGVDTFVVATHELSNGVLVNFDTSFEIPRNESLEIQGTRGVLRVKRPFKAVEFEELQIVRGPDEVETIAVSDPQNPYEREIGAFVDILKGRQSAPRLDPLGLELILKTLRA